MTMDLNSPAPGMPIELIVTTQTWLDLVRERDRLNQEADGEMSYDALRSIEDQQLTAATLVADYCSTWLRNLGVIT